MGIEPGLTRTKLVARLREERDPRVLGAFTSHRWWQVRWEAIESLGKTGSPAAEPYLLQVLATSDNKYDLGNAIVALGLVGTQAAIPALTGFIHHPVEDVKASAINAIGVLGDSSYTPLYLDALADHSWVAKWSAMGAIHRNGDATAIGPVIARLRAILSRERRVLIGGWSEVMYALDYLRRWQATDPSAAETIEWVRARRIDRLQPDEREWFASTFPQ